MFLRRNWSPSLLIFCKSDLLIFWSPVKDENPDDHYTV
jgi:hypothetical protein